MPPFRGDRCLTCRRTSEVGAAPALRQHTLRRVDPSSSRHADCHYCRREGHDGFASRGEELLIAYMSGGVAHAEEDVPGARRAAASRRAAERRSRARRMPVDERGVGDEEVASSSVPSPMAEANERDRGGAVLIT